MASEGKKTMLISFSGGATSGFMMWWLLKNKSDEYDFIIVFANTGRENDETLLFVKQCAENCVFENHEGVQINMHICTVNKLANKHITYINEYIYNVQ